MHNDDDLVCKYANDKNSYLRNFKFNLCPENSSNVGYVTEKIFDAIYSGCIPIYWGNGSEYPEQDVINHDAVVFLKHRTLDRDLYEVDPMSLPQEDNAEVLDFIRYLNENDKAYRDFASQPRLVPGAADAIWGYFERFENKLTEILLQFK